MSLIAERLNSYETNFWDFKDDRPKGIHTIAKYPATMVAPMQYKLIEEIISVEDKISNILDPFHGSGTTLVEGKKFGLELFGIDINPLANLITKVKLVGVDQEELKKSLEKFENNLNNLNLNFCHYFEKINKWFKPDIIDDLTRIRETIKKESDIEIRRYFWVCFSDVIRKYSNTRSNTFKLHVKEKKDIEQMKNEVIKDYLLKISTSFLDLPDSNAKTDYNLFLGDVTKNLKVMKENSIDLICTSPPYGDNPTTVTYGQYSILQLLWIEKSDCSQFDEKLIGNFSKLDNISLGGNGERINNLNLKTLNKILEQISKDKRKKVINFFIDYNEVFREMARVLKQNSLIVLTVGNRRVDNIVVELDKISIELAELYNLSLDVKLNREIPYKRMPKKLSSVGELGAVESMNKEIILIFRKNKIEEVINGEIAND